MEEEEQSRYNDEQIADARNEIREALTERAGDDLMWCLQVSLMKISDTDVVAYLDGVTIDELFPASSPA